MGKNGDSGSTSGPPMVPIRSTTGWTPLPWRLCVVSGSTAFLKATIRCGSSAAGSGSSSCQRVSVRPAYTPMLLATANLRTPQVRAASSALSTPVVSVRKKQTGSSSGRLPATWTMSLMSWRPARARKASRSVTSRGSTVTPPARNDGTSVRWCAVTTTSCPRSTSARAVWAPIMPSPPVTRIIGPPRSGGGSRRELMEEAATGAQQDGHLVEDHLVDEVRFQPGGQHAAAHEGDVLALGGLACRRDRVLDAGGDERLRLADLGRGPVAEDEESRRRVRATASPMAGVLVGGAPRDSRPHSFRDGVKEPSARLTQPESVEHLARRVPVGVPVEEHGRVTETASELLVAVGSSTTDIAVDRDGVGAEDLAHVSPSLLIRWLGGSRRIGAGRRRS